MTIVDPLHVKIGSLWQIRYKSRELLKAHYPLFPNLGLNDTIRTSKIVIHIVKEPHSRSAQVRHALSTEFYLSSTSLSANVKNHICLCLPSRRWFSSTDPGELRKRNCCGSESLRRESTDRTTASVLYTPLYLADSDSGTFKSWMFAYSYG